MNEQEQATATARARWTEVQQTIRAVMRLKASAESPTEEAAIHQAVELLEGLSRLRCQGVARCLEAEAAELNAFIARNAAPKRKRKAAKKK